MIGYFGWKVTAAYIIGGLVMGVAAGSMIGRMRQERYLVEDMAGSTACASVPAAFGTFGARISYGIHEARSVLARIWVWVLVGVGLGAIIHNYIPQEAVNSLVSKTGFFAVPLAVLLGVPLYGSCAAIIPIALVLFEKGFPLGTSLAFMMAVAALSLPEAFMLRRVMRLPLVLLFFGVTALCITVTGYVFNLLQGILV
jgi:uncharacterized membrane protein YraQ (UPF0718 family)